MGAQSQQVTVPIQSPIAGVSHQANLPTAPASVPSAKETRLAPAGYTAPSYQQPAVQYETQPQMGYPVAQPRGSFLSRLTWVHYSLAACGLLFLLAVPFVAFLLLKPTPPPRPAPAAVTPAPASTPAPAPETRTPVPNPATPGQTAIAPGAEPPRAPSGPGEADRPAGVATSGERKSNTVKRESDAAAREKARKAAEARRLLSQ